MQPNPQFSADLVTLTEEILNGRLQFLCSVECEIKRMVFKVFLDSRMKNSVLYGVFFKSFQFKRSIMPAILKKL